MDTDDTQQSSRLQDSQRPFRQLPIVRKTARQAAAIVLVVALSSNIAYAAPIHINNTGNYNSTEGYHMIISNSHTDTNQKNTLGSMIADAALIAETTLGDVQALLVKPGTAVSFTYGAISDMISNDIPDTRWHIVSDSQKTVNASRPGGT